MVLLCATAGHFSFRSHDEQTGLQAFRCHVFTHSTFIHFEAIHFKVCGLFSIHIRDEHTDRQAVLCLGCLALIPKPFACHDME